MIVAAVKNSWPTVPSANPLERAVETMVALALRVPERYQPFLVEGFSPVVQENLRDLHLKLIEYVLLDFTTWGNLDVSRILAVAKAELEQAEYLVFGEFLSVVRNLDVEAPPEPRDLIGQMEAAVARIIEAREERRERKRKKDQVQAVISRRDDGAPDVEAIAGLPPDLTEFHPTDLWTGGLFVYLHRDKVRYCKRLGGWYFYDGQRWARETCGEVVRLAKDTARKILEMASTEPNDRLRGEMAKHSLRTEAAGKLESMLEIARTESGVVVPPDVFDPDPWLLNVQNGTLDLRTGELRPPRAEDMITNLSPAEWRGLDARGERFEMFLSEAMDFDQEKYDFLQRAAGYTLSGDMREQVFFFLHGPEAAGKGTFVRAMKDVMGTYARSTEIGTFLPARRDTVRNDVAALVGSRLVTASEPEEGQVFDEGLIKILTGQDQTTARFMFQEFFEFFATFKLWLQGNHRPHIRSTGGAMWRRLLIVPFTKTVPEERRDKTLGDALRSPEERAGILAWMVRGCLEWQRDGLRPPTSVRAAVAAYRTAEDRLAPFLEECTSANKSAQVPKGSFYAAYKTWAEESGERPMSKRAVGTRMEEIGFAPDDRISGGIRVWNGIFLVDRDAK